MKKCELCDSLAKMYCESDQASLCWDCDANVHSANFLVAKHSRTLLCHLCQSFTPWTGSGPRLCPTVSVCQNCVNSREGRGNNNEDDKEDDDDDNDDLDREDNTDDDEDDDNADGDDDGGDEDDEENQVVPWSSTPPPPASSSSNSGECATRFCNSDEGASQSRTASSLKGMRETAEHSAQDRLVGCLSSQNNLNARMSNESASVGTLILRPLKCQTRTMIEYSQKGLHKATTPEEKKSRMIFHMCNLNKATGFVDGIVAK